MDERLLKMLVCPETKHPVTEVDDRRLSQLNALIQQGKLVNRDGKIVRETLQSGLIRSDEQILYPIRSDIPVMLMEEGIPMNQLL